MDKATEPGLLRCCSLIRHEARPISLHENRFETFLQKGKMEPHLGHWHWHWLRLRECNRVICHAGDVTWTNLMDWLNAFWEGEVSSARFEAAFGDRDSGYWTGIELAVRAFGIVSAMEGKISGETVCAVLDEFTDAAGLAAERGLSIAPYLRDSVRLRAVVSHHARQSSAKTRWSDGAMRSTEQHFGS